MGTRMPIENTHDVLGSHGFEFIGPQPPANYILYRRGSCECTIFDDGSWSLTIKGQTADELDAYLRG